MNMALAGSVQFLLSPWVREQNPQWMDGSFSQGLSDPSPSPKPSLSLSSPHANHILRGQLQRRGGSKCSSFPHVRVSLFPSLPLWKNLVGRKEATTRPCGHCSSPPRSHAGDQSLPLGDRPPGQTAQFKRVSVTWDTGAFAAHTPPSFLSQLLLPAHLLQDNKSFKSRWPVNLQYVGWEMTNMPPTSISKNVHAYACTNTHTFFLATSGSLSCTLTQLYPWGLRKEIHLLNDLQFL